MSYTNNLIFIYFRVQKPPYTYVGLICVALLSSRQKRLKLKDLYDRIKLLFPLMDEMDRFGWCNTVRQTLSKFEVFKLVGEKVQVILKINLDEKEITTGQNQTW